MSIKLGKYIHFKGDHYEAIASAYHSETLEEMVVYHSSQDSSKVWVRPLTLWNEEVEKGGRMIKRFTYVGEIEDVN